MRLIGKDLLNLKYNNNSIGLNDLRILNTMKRQF